MLRSLHSGFRVFGLALLISATFAGYAETLVRHASPKPDSSTLVVEGLGKGAVWLDGPWQFHLGDDPAYAKPDIDDSAAQGWEQLSAEKPWGLQGHASYTGFAWYRRRISLTPAPGASPEFAMLLNGVDNAYELYWNGILVGRNGQMPPHPVWYFTQMSQTFGLGPIRSGVLAVRVWRAPLASFDNGQLGGFSTPPLVGSPEAITALKSTSDYRWLRSRQFQFGLNSLYALVAALSLLVWLRNRRQWLLVWLALFSLAPIVNFFLLGMPTGISDAVALGLAQPVFGVTDVSLWFLLLWLLQLQEHQTLARLVRIAAVIDIVVTLLDGALNFLNWSSNWVVWAQVSDGILTGAFTILETLPLVLVTYAIVRRTRLDLARGLMAFFAFSTEMISVVRITASQGSRFTHWTLANRISSPLFTLNGNPISLVTLSSTLLLISIIFAVYRYSVENSRRQSALEQELKNARELQQVLVPETLPALPGFALTSSYRPAHEVGGDFFQILPLEDGSALVVLGDVSGKGLRAAMAVSLIVGAMRMIVEYSTSPSAILSALNRRLHGRLQGGFATAIAMRIGSDGSCVVASAGHLPPFLNHRELALSGSLPLGLSIAAEYEETTHCLREGDHLALFTDGLVEARSQTGELYGFARLEQLFAARPSAAQATEAAVNFGQDDDITVLTLTRLGAGEQCSASHSVPELATAEFAA